MPEATKKGQRGLATYNTKIKHESRTNFSKPSTGTGHLRRPRKAIFEESELCVMFQDHEMNADVRRTRTMKRGKRSS